MSERILVGAEDGRIAAIGRDGLPRMGFRVELAADGLAALVAVGVQPFDLGVLDRLLPGMDGVEVCQRLHARGGPPGIMLTARDAVAEKIAGLDNGADDYLTKPFVLEELVARVRAVLRRHAPRPPAPLRVADLRRDAQGRRAWRGGRGPQLTPRGGDPPGGVMEPARPGPTPTAPPGR